MSANVTKEKNYAKWGWVSLIVLPVLTYIIMAIIGYTISSLGVSDSGARFFSFFVGILIGLELLAALYLFIRASATSKLYWLASSLVFIVFVFYTYIAYIGLTLD